MYRTECIYEPFSDHRRKGVYKKPIDALKTRDSTLQTLIQAIVTYPEDDALALVREIRSCKSLDDVADSILAASNSEAADENDEPSLADCTGPEGPTFEAEVSGKMAELRLEDGSVRFLGGTSNLIYGGLNVMDRENARTLHQIEPDSQEQSRPITSWTSVTSEPDLIIHLVNMYFTWHYSYFTTLSRSLFFRDFLRGKPPQDRPTPPYCSELLVNAILSLGCHFTSVSGAREDPASPATAGDHFFKEAKKLLLLNDEYEKPQLTTVQALALMSVREAGCGREAKGWIYSGMSFRMAYDVGLNLETGILKSGRDLSLDERAIDARRITFWGCFLFDK